MPRHFWFAQLFQKLGGQKRWNASVRAAQHTRQTGRQSPRENTFGTPFGRPVKRVGQTLVVIQSPRKTKQHLHQFWTTMLPGLFI